MALFEGLIDNGDSTKVGLAEIPWQKRFAKLAGREHACIVGVGGRVLWVKVWGGRVAQWAW
jgi:hypothetical protein